MGGDFTCFAFLSKNGGDVQFILNALGAGQLNRRHRSNLCA